jgi:hypothetical protein
MKTLAEKAITPYQIPGVISIGPLVGLDLTVGIGLDITAKLQYQMTNQLVDFFAIAPGKSSGSDATRLVMGSGEEQIKQKPLGFYHQTGLSVLPASEQMQSVSVFAAVNGFLKVALQPRIEFGISGFSKIVQAVAGVQGSAALILAAAANANCAPDQYSLCGRPPPEAALRSKRLR